MRECRVEEKSLQTISNGALFDGKFDGVIGEMTFTN